MTNLTGKHALVTGGGSGIGAAIARTLAGAGAVVTICGLRADGLETVAKQSSNINAQIANVTDENALSKLYRDAQSARGTIDIVVANAGVARSAPVDKLSLDVWQKTIDVNLTGAFLSVKPALEGMRTQRWGRIVFVASTAGLKGYPYVAAYVAAKHGVIGLTRALAAETAKQGVTVNAVCPGFTETPLLERSVHRIAATTEYSEAEARELLRSTNPQGRFITPQEVADTVLWLCADTSASITGQAISVSGGETW